MKTGRIRYFFYGEHKVGKSILCAAANKSIFLDLENGTRFIDCIRHRWPKDTDLTMAHVKDAIVFLTENPRNYRHLWIDGLEVLEVLIHQDVVAEANRRNKKNLKYVTEIGGGYGKGERIALIYWRELTNLLDRLRDATDMSVGIIGHAKLGKRKDVGATDWDCWMPNIDLGAWHVLAEWVDVFAFLGFEQGGTKDAQDLFSRGKGWQTGRRFIHTVRDVTYYAGRRFKLPDRIEMIHPEQGDPWAPFAHAIDMITIGEDNEILAAIMDELKRIADEDMTKTTKKWLGESQITKDQLVRTLRKLRSK